MVCKNIVEHSVTLDISVESDFTMKSFMKFLCLSTFIHVVFYCVFMISSLLIILC